MEGLVFGGGAAGWAVGVFGRGLCSRFGAEGLSVAGGGVGGGGDLAFAGNRVRIWLSRKGLAGVLVEVRESGARLWVDRRARRSD